MKLEVGECYRTRDGRKVGPLEETLWPELLVGGIGGGANRLWNISDGTHGDRDSEEPVIPNEPDYDLVAEWVEENPPCVAQELADEPILDAAFGQQKAEPAWKQDGGKPRMDLIAPEMLFGVAEVLRFGAAKYAERNWEAGMSWGRCFGALMRHLWAWWRGEAKDAETGFSHLHHAACCLMFLIAYEERKIGTDDRKITVDTSDG